MIWFVKNSTWLAATVAITVVMGVVYVAVQQSLRLGANEPQRSMAQDAAYAIQHRGVQSRVWEGTSRVDTDLNMAPFVIVYDRSGNVVAGDGYLDGVIPRIPKGVLDHAQAKGQDSVTWAPRPEVRIAAVAVPAGDNYFVVSGRSLAVTESTISSFTRWLASVGAASMVAVAITFLAVGARTKTK